MSHLELVRQPEPLKIQNASFLLIGDSGEGKTTMLGTGTPESLILQFDDNELSLRRIQRPWVRVQDWDHLKEIRAEIAGKLSEGSFPFDALALDAVSNTEAFVIQNVCGKPRAVLSDWPNIVPEWRDTMKSFLEFSKPGRYEQTIDVIFTARRTYEKSEADGRMWAVPDVPGRKLPAELISWFDIVLQLHTEEAYEDGKAGVRYFNHTQSEGMYKAKDSSNCLDFEEENDLTAIKAKIQAGLA